MCRATESANEILPAPPSTGLRRLAGPIAAGYVACTAIYFGCHSYLSQWDLLQAADEFCPPSSPGCRRNDLAAFQAVSGVMLSYLGLTGFRAWAMTKRAHQLLPDTPEGRFFGTTLPEADWINAAIVVFQGWDFVGSLFVEEHRTAIMLTHHLMALACGAFCLHYEINPYYAVYYGGVCEFSSIFLVFVDFFRYFPPLQDSTLSKFEFFCQVAFVATFFYYRVVCWIRLTYRGLLPDCRHVLGKGLIAKYRPGAEWFVYYLGTCGVVLGALQLFWFFQIIQVAMETL